MTSTGMKIEKSKDVELNRILDKISGGIAPTRKEKDFLANYVEISDTDVSSSSLMSKNEAVSRIQTLISNKKKVVCEICDRNGKIDDLIVSVENNFEKEHSTVFTRHGDSVRMYDRFFYSIVYDFDTDSYFLYQGEEFFEKIEVKK
jgi:hypothetical protein